MKQFQKKIISVILLFALLLLSANLFFSYQKNENIEKRYNIEINRIFQNILKNGQTKHVDLSFCSYVEKVEYLPPKSPPPQVESFFESHNKQSQIRPITLEDDRDPGYLKFTYTLDIKQQLNQLQLAANLVMLFFASLAIGVLIYIHRKIVLPFEKMTDMPLQLAKGHLSSQLEEEKNQFDSNFIWGLNMLKEHIEDNKNKMLRLEREKKTLILSLSHDVKTPLSAIKLYTKALNENLYGQAEKRTQMLEQINKNTEEIEQFVQDIISATKENFLHIEVNNRDFYLAALMKRLTNYYSEKLSFLKTELTVATYEDCLLYGDAERSLEVLENIIENAMKYGDGKKISIGFQTEERCQLITVSNSGNTLPARELVHIFESFWRGSNTTGKKGSGLGLYICRQIMTKMNGDIYAEIDDDQMSVTVVLKKA